MKRARRRRWLVGTVIILVAGIGIVAATLSGKPGTADLGDSKGKSADRRAEAKTIRAKRDPSFQVTSHQLAIVEAYFKADLRARASGTVSRVTKDINQRVKRGEVLIDIDVPDLLQDVSIKDGVVAQRMQEAIASQAKARSARALVEVAKASVTQRTKEVGLAVATREFREKRLERYQGLLNEKAIGPDVFDEQKRDYLLGVASVEAAIAAVEKAQADQKEIEAKLEEAEADIKLKESLVEIARRDLERAHALADFAHVIAPFDGVITKRNVDPGAFVQNATTGSSEPLLSIARMDFVTIVTRLPDNEAAFVDNDTEISLEMNGLSGGSIQGRVTRFSPTVQNNDLTMRVEVDLFNGTEAEYIALQRSVISNSLAILAAKSCLQSIPLSMVALHGQESWQKSPGDPLPIRPRILDAGTKPFRLLPGMTGTIELRLSRTSAAYLLPSSAVYSINGKQYILIVRDGKTVQVPVQVQVDDGTVAKVNMIVTGDGRSKGRDVVRELTGEEEIVASRQVEIGDNRNVSTTLSDWNIGSSRR
ncbi:MAG: efflux RND transporter periplasmic adaptor subunit [Planctomycetes bacterium]|nr:efflux RND transporter periplasmic adaptor subunit [Planctomycetota bacterium]